MCSLLLIFLVSTRPVHARTGLTSWCGLVLKTLVITTSVRTYISAYVIMHIYTDQLMYKSD